MPNLIFDRAAVWLDLPPLTFRRLRPALSLLLFASLITAARVCFAFPSDVDGAPSLPLQQTPPPASPAEVRALAPGETLRRDMRSGELHAYRLTLAQGDYVRVVVEQEGVDVVVSIYDPERRPLIHMDSPN